ncbi:CBS domain-containing protein [Thermodesulfovibrionales bacterium]|nr:CBS domain-containing protein [Thermodesulfovibrionales bacterium]
MLSTCLILIMYNEYYTEGGRDEAKGHFRYEDDFGDNVGDVIRTMAEKNIGCVIVKENGDILGIFTERDILMCHAKGISLNNEIVKDVMTKNPLTFDEATFHARDMLPGRTGLLIWRQEYGRS